MTAKPLLHLVLLALPFSFPAVADTNLAGDEIIILGDQPAAANQAPSPSINPGPHVDPVLSYLPDDAAANADAADAGNVAVLSDDLWQRIKDGYAMPEAQSQFTSVHESWYSSRPDYVKRMVARSQKYLYHIVEEVQKRGMPTEIALLPMVESAFNPQANSRSRASGIWQFVPATGKDFGLKQNWWVDNRRDITAATDAALTYLQKLHVMFGTWDLALAAYNAGEGTVQRAIERNRRQGLPTDYASLALPPETQNYVPKLQAVKNIMTNPEQYGLAIASIPNRPYFTKVTAPQQIDARLAAQLAEVTPEEFASLNPEYNRPVLAETGKVHEILLPVGAAETFKTNLASYDKPLVSWQTYHARRGERMESIARKFGIGLAQLCDVNDLPSRNKLVMSRPLLVPGKGGTLAMAEPAITQPVKPANSRGVHGKTAKLKRGMRYVVKRGDTLDSIARKFDVARDDLQRWNKINGSHILPGHVIMVMRGDEA